MVCPCWGVPCRPPDNKTLAAEETEEMVVSTHEEIHGESISFSNTHLSIEDNQIQELLLKIDSIFKKKEINCKI